MKVFNKTRNCEIANNAEVAQSLLERMKGLLGRKNLAEGEGLLLKPCFQIHTFFMKFPIDVLFLTNGYEVIKTITNFKPFRISNLYMRSGSALELPCGVIEKTKTEAGDLISFEN